MDRGLFKEQELLNKVLALDEDDAFNTLYDEFHNLIWFLAKQVITNDEDIAELEINVFEKIFRNVRKIENPESFKAYVGSIINNEIRGMFKKLKRNKCTILDVEEIDCLANNTTRSDEFDDLIAYLEPFEGVVMINKFVFCMEISQIAKCCNLTELQTRRIIDKSLEKIRNCLDKDGYYVKGIRSSNKKDDQGKNNER